MRYPVLWFFVIC